MSAVVGVRRRSIAGVTARLALVVLAGAIILGPLASLVIWSFAEQWFWPNHWPTQWGLGYWERALSGRMLDALLLSFGIALIVTAICIVITVPLAYLLARSRLPFGEFFLLVFLLPQAFPQMPVFANLVTEMYRWNLAGTIPGVVLIHLVGAIVFAVWTLVSVFRTIRPNLEEASYSLGAGRVSTFFRISLPMAVPGIVAAALLVFVYSLDEFTGTLLVGSPFVVTMPVFMYAASNGYEMQIASVTGVLLTIPGIVLLLVLRRFMRSEYLAAFGR